MENAEITSTNGSTLDELVELKKREAMDKGIYEKAYSIAKIYGTCAGGHTRLYEEREPNSKFLGFIPRTKRTFAIEYDEFSDIFCGKLSRYMRIYEGDTLVFETEASDVEGWAEVFGWNKPKIERYISSGGWVKHLEDISLNGPKALQQELRNRFNL